jgi:hypothetical protein
MSGREACGMDDVPIDPSVLADDLLTVLDSVLAATAGRMLVAFEEHGLGLEEGRLLLEPHRHVVQHRATRRVRSRMRQRGLITSNGYPTAEGRRLAAILRRTARAALSEEIERMPRAQQLRMAGAVHLLAGDLEAVEAPAEWMAR